MQILGFHAQDVPYRLGLFTEWIKASVFISRVNTESGKNFRGIGETKR